MVCFKREGKKENCMRNGVKLEPCCWSSFRKKQLNTTRCLNDLNYLTSWSLTEEVILTLNAFKIY